MENIKNITELEDEELLSISGGHEGLFYKLGVLWMDANLRVLGTMAGIIDGFDSEVKG